MYKAIHFITVNRVGFTSQVITAIECQLLSVVLKYEFKFSVVMLQKQLFTVLWPNST